MKYLISFIIFIFLAVAVVLSQGNHDDAVIENEADNNPPIENSIGDISSSVLKIEHYMENSEGTIMKQASAVVIASDDDFYYLVSNFHILIKDDYVSKAIKAYDSLGRVQDAFVVFGLDDTELINLSVAYDLVLLKISKQFEVEVAKAVDKELSHNDLVTAIGYPNKLRRLTTGHYIESRYILGFVNQMIVFDAPIEPGSSGGGLFTTSGKLIGITTASLNDHDGTFIEGYAIPIRFVDEYITLIIL